MWAHKAIEDLLNAHQVSQSKDYSLACKTVVELLKKSQHFYFGHCSEYIELLPKNFYDEPLFLGNLAENIWLPYEICAFWFDNSSDSYDERYPDITLSKKGVLCLSTKRRRNENEILIFSLNYINELRSWVIYDLPCTVCIGKKLYNNGLSNIVPLDSILGDVNKSLNKSKSDRLAKDMQQDLSALNSTLMLLSCKNIELETNYPSGALNKKRRKKNKVEIFSYYTLKLKPFSPKRQSKKAEHQSEWSNRIHLCRGHFKKFSEEKPLFGKYTGMFWWQPQVRGDKKQGVVQKDYQVEV